MQTTMANRDVLKRERLKYEQLLSLGAVGGPVLFLVAWLALGLAQPAIRGQYGVIGGLQGTMTNPISALGVGPNAGLFNDAFVVCGLLTLAGTLGAMLVASVRTPIACPAILLGLSPVGLALAGIFSLAASLLMHNVAALLVFVAPIAAFPVSAGYLQRAAKWRWLRIGFYVATPLTLALLVLFVCTFHLSSVVAGEGVAGLTERLLLTEIHACYVFLGWSGWKG